MHEYSHHIDAVEAGLSAAVQDALGETRTSGRTAFAAYAAALPERAAALLKRFDAGLQQKLHEAVLQYGKGSHAGERGGLLLSKAATVNDGMLDAARLPWSPAHSLTLDLLCHRTLPTQPARCSLLHLIHSLFLAPLLPPISRLQLWQR